MTDDPSNPSSAQSIRDQLWAHAIPYTPEVMSGGKQPKAEARDVEVDTSQVTEAAKAMWTQLKSCAAVSGSEVLTLTLPAPGDTDSEFGVDASDVPQNAHRDLLSKAAALSAVLFELPLTQQLALTFRISSDGTLEFTSLLESHLDNFDPGSAEELPGFFADFARRMTIAGEEETRETEDELKTYVVSCRVGGDNFNTSVPATSARQAARAFGAIMDICFFQEGTFDRIEAVQLQDALEDWRSKDRR